MEAEVKPFDAWLVEGGVHLHNVIAANVVQGGRGVVATSDIPAGSLLVQVPEALMMTTQSAYRDLVLAPALKKKPSLLDTQVLAVHLLHEVSKKKESFWYPYIRQLPRAYSTLANFTEEEAAAFQVPYAVNVAESAREAAKKEWRDVYPILRELELPKPLRTLGAWVWAAGTVASRTVFVPFDKAGALCPFGDLFNYAPPPPPADPEVEEGPLLHALDAERWRDALGADTCPEASLSTAAAAEDMEEEDMLCAECHALTKTGMVDLCGDSKSIYVCGEGNYDEERREYQFWARAPYKRGQQLFMCYGQYTNLDLANLYGFLLPGLAPQPLNGHDSVPIPPALLKQVDVDPACVDLVRSSMHILASGAPSWGLLAVLRLASEPSHLRPSLAQHANAGERISIQGDADALARLACTCRRLLQELPTSIPDDCSLLHKLHTTFQGTPVELGENDANSKMAADQVTLPGAESHPAMAVEWRLCFKLVLLRAALRCEATSDELRRECGYQGSG